MKSRLVISLALVAVTVAVFWRVGHNGFIIYDDPDYVYGNRHVVAGLSLDNVLWAFTATDEANWHPLTWLSHMVDCQLFGLNPAGHHFTSLLLHALNTVLLFLLLCRVSGALWRSAFVAALFALHPLHVESVAWVAERKDVLAALFWMLTMLAYARYVDRPGWRSYAPVIVCFVLGLMAKPMLVTLPFVLLLFDYWPLGRIGFGRPGPGAAAPNPSPLRLVLEKVPLFALTAASSIITVYAQHKGEAIASLEKISAQMRVATALTAWWEYIEKMVWPANLSVIYPLEMTAPVGGAAAAGVLLLSISLLAVRGGRRFPYLPVGWFWYLGTLVPVIGLVQVGVQSMADRYTYIPFIGLFIMISWGVPDLLEKWRGRDRALAVSAILVLAVLAAVTWRRLGEWKNSVTLFTQAVQATDNNYVAQNSLGSALLAQRRVEEAISHIETSLAINPNYHTAYNNLGVALAMTGRREEAIARFTDAVRLKPDYADAHYNLGVALMEQGWIEEAARQFAEALRLQPGYPDARRKLEHALRLLNGAAAR